MIYETGMHLSLFVVGILLLTNCTPYGLLYTHIKKPLDIDMSHTHVSDHKEQGDIKHIRFYVDVMWDSNAIGDIAQKDGIETIYYADIEIFSILTIWNQYTVHVYGK